MDETLQINSSFSPAVSSPALRETLRVGSICNNARLNEEGNFIGQSTDVALLEVLTIFGISDDRIVCVSPFQCPWKLTVTRNLTAPWSDRSIRNRNSWPLAVPSSPIRLQENVVS